MTFQDKRNLWFVSGNKDKDGNTVSIHTVSVCDIEPGAVFESDVVARLTDDDIDGVRRYVVVAATSGDAIETLRAHQRQERLR
jgi:hypothetical protein